VCGPDGVADFYRLRAAVARKGSRDAFLYAFDVLELNGCDPGHEPWDTRRQALASLLGRVEDGIRLSEQLDGVSGETVFQRACKLGLEGIVAKRRDRPLSIRTVVELDQSAEPECARGDSAARRVRGPTSTQA
jgi:ATP-dependent DNA ligase